MRNIFFVVSAFMSIGNFAQSEEGKRTLKAAMNSKELTYQGNESLKSDKPTQAEVDCRSTTAEDGTDLTAQYNLGILLCRQKNYGEVFAQLIKAADARQMSETERHQIFHNLGNVFMKEETYDKAILAYREALRYDPIDEEMRYNLAVASEMLKENPFKSNNKNNKDNRDNKGNKGNKDNKDKNKDNKDNRDENQDKKDDKDKNKDSKDNKDDKDKNEDNKDKDNKDNKNKDKDNRNDRDKDNKDQNKDNKDGQQGSREQDGQPRPSSLSPKQMEYIPEAINNEEHKTRDKVSGQKVRGQRTKSGRNW